MHGLMREGRRKPVLYSTFYLALLFEIVIHWQAILEKLPDSSAGSAEQHA
jgi:hypothetical protein